MAAKEILWCRQLCSPSNSKQPCRSVHHSLKLLRTVLPTAIIMMTVTIAIIVTGLSNSNSDNSDSSSNNNRHVKLENAASPAAVRNPTCCRLQVCLSKNSLRLLVLFSTILTAQAAINKPVANCRCSFCSLTVQHGYKSCSAVCKCRCHLLCCIYTA